jgi:hypothetical protein
MSATVNGKQAGYLMVLARKAGMDKQQFMEWLEYDSGWDLVCDEPEDVPLIAMDSLVRKLIELEEE